MPRTELSRIVSNPAVTQLSTINCSVSGGTTVQALLISPASITISQSAGATAAPAATIIGGTPKYSAEITTSANASGLTPALTPLNIKADVNGTAVTLTNSKAVQPGSGYNFGRHGCYRGAEDGDRHCKVNERSRPVLAADAQENY
jgi:hypothetical protein